MGLPLEEGRQTRLGQVHAQRQFEATHTVLRDSTESSLDPLMVDLMLLDTAKHIAILEHITSRLS